MRLAILRGLALCVALETLWRGSASAHLPVLMGLSAHRQAGPVDPGNEPLPRLSAETKVVVCQDLRAVGTGPHETTLMQSSLGKPHAGAVPQQKLQTIAPCVAEEIEPTPARRRFESALYARRQPINTQTHVNGFDDQQYLLGYRRCDRTQMRQHVRPVG